MNDFVYGDDRLADNPLPVERGEFDPEAPAEVAERELRGLLATIKLTDEQRRIMLTYYTRKDLDELVEDLADEAREMDEVAGGVLGGDAYGDGEDFGVRALIEKLKERAAEKRLHAEIDAAQHRIFEEEVDS